VFVDLRPMTFNDSCAQIHQRRWCRGVRVRQRYVSWLLHFKVASLRWSQLTQPRRICALIVKRQVISKQRTQLEHVASPTAPPQLVQLLTAHVPSRTRTPAATAKAAHASVCKGPTSAETLAQRVTVAMAPGARQLLPAPFGLPLAAFRLL
jgi:hypothetical protein